MESTRLLYLRLKLSQNEAFLDAQLQKGGFKLTKKTGTGIESFRNYYYEMTGAPGALEVFFKIIPGKNSTETLSISLSPDIHPKHVELFFNILKELVIKIPFDLLDLKVRNKIYEQLHQEGKVDAYYVGLDPQEQIAVEQQAYIPLDAKLFLKMGAAEEVTVTAELEGERAPELDG